MAVIRPLVIEPDHGSRACGEDLAARFVIHVEGVSLLVGWIVVTLGGRVTATLIPVSIIEEPRIAVFFRKRQPIKGHAAPPNRQSLPKSSIANLQSNPNST